ncbi:MAG: 30S ribosome-binding factor RbfA [Erysipelotrichaceae bacterium]|nr:30S ribosome-binding factor RbfA [Erysipelotrichaceae bacterium]
MASSHLAQIESTLYREISLILQREFNDPKLGFVTVSEVKVSPDLSHAKVYVSFLGKEERNTAGLKVLNKARPYVRSLCAKRVRLRKMPELTFVLDDSLKQGERIEQLIQKIEAENEDMEQE